MEEMADVELPRGIALAWGVAANPQRGPKREMSVERIVEAAIDIADAEGLGAVSMSAVAARLGFTTMSLYRYVSAKEDLLLLMQDQAIGLPSREPLEAASWQQGLTIWYRESLQMYAAHPWILDIDITGLPSTPNNLVWMDCGLAVLRETPLSHQERLATMLVITGNARWEGYINRGYEARARRTGISPSERDIADAHIMSTLVTQEQFPFLFAAIQSGVFEKDDNPFEYGLSRLIDGVEQYIAAVVSDPVRQHERAEERMAQGRPARAYPKDERVRAARQARREAENRLREAVRREDDAVDKALEKERKAQEAEARAAEKRNRSRE